MSAFSSPGAAAIYATDAQARAQSSSAAALTPANLAARGAFSAHKNGTNQTAVPSGSDTQVTFGTAFFDRGGLYVPASSKLVSAGGAWHFDAVVDLQTTLTGASYLMLFKNGSVDRYGPAVKTFASGGNPLTLNVDVDSVAGDEFTLVINATAGSALTIYGGQKSTYFNGHAT